MAINPYGLHSSPAVGGGLPGLPRRQKRVVTQADAIDLKQYRIVIARANGLQMYRADGELLAEGFPGSALDVSTNMCVDHGQKLVLLVDSTGAANTTTATLYDTNDLSMVSQIQGASGYSLSQGAVDSKLGLIALTSGADLRVYSLQDFISANGGTVNDLTPVLTNSSAGDLTGGIAWNPQGTLLGTLGRGTGGRVLLRRWPDLSVFQDIAGSTGGGSGSCGFTGKGAGFWYSRHASTSSVDLRMRKLTYDATGQGVDSVEVVAEQASTFSSSLRKCSGLERHGQLAILYLGDLYDYVQGGDPENLQKSLLFSGASSIPPVASVDGKVVVIIVNASLRVAVLRQSPLATRPADPFFYDYTLFDQVSADGKGPVVNSVVVGGAA